MSGLFATRPGEETITAGCASGQPAGWKLHISHAFIPPAVFSAIRRSGAPRRQILDLESSKQGVSLSM